jgi:hypothetical protein
VNNERQTKRRRASGVVAGEKHMKIILIPLVWLMIPVAFVVVVFDIAKAAIEEKIETKLREKNT